MFVVAAVALCFAVASALRGSLSGFFFSSSCMFAALGFLKTPELLQARHRELAEQAQSIVDRRTRTLFRLCVVSCLVAIAALASGR
jgi:hypothetical protein